MLRRIGLRVAPMSALAVFAVLCNTACTRELREGVLSGASSYAADAAYGLLAELLPFPLGDASGGSGGGDDPFGDVPLQM